MQPVTVQEQVEYASLGWRFTAVLIDTVVLFCIWTVMLLVDMIVLMGRSGLNASDPAAAQALSREITQKIIDQQLGNSNLLFYVIVFGSLFVYYLLLESFFAASVGKVVCRMRVTMVDGSRPTGVAILVRNLVRVPEAMFFYIPSGISCSASPRRERLGDYAAHTVVVRRRLVPAGGAARPAPGAPPRGAPAAVPGRVRRARPARARRAAGPEPAARPGGGSHRGRPPTPWRTRSCDSRRRRWPHAVRTSTTCTSRSASSRPAPTTRPGAYSEEYVSAWFTLTDSVAALRAARDNAAAAAQSEGRTLEDACAPQPDLAHLLRELEPYFTADGDDAVHAAFLAVARADAPRP